MRTDLPAGVVTFLVTDVEGSTRLLRRLGAEAYSRALLEHRRVVRAACRARGGVEVDTQGDAFLMAFPSGSAAVDAAGALVAELRDPITVRVGLHTGTPLVNDEGYVGEDVHIASRVAAAAHGGQVVLSGATRALVGPETPLVDLGEHRLKDLADPIRIFQLGTQRFPPLASIGNTNLPRPASTFVGRARELAAIISRVAGGARLVTLTGPGGSGKTRLALEAAAVLVRERNAGVFWVPLASIREPSLVPEVIAQAIGAKQGLAETIGSRDLVLLLDNLEQVIDAAPGLATLVSACPNLTLIVTSRELLRVQGEIEFPVPPLVGSEAVELFCERSALESTPDIAEICARLDNLPLAVELAAARTRALSPSDLLDRLGGRLDLLRGGRDADPRQQTLRATIAWSHELLTSAEQRGFRRLSAFAGGCRLADAEAVVEVDLDVLQSLVEKSLLRLSGDRYRMLETIREFAAERLDESPESDAIRSRHAHHVLWLVEQAETELEGGDQGMWLARLADEHDNIRAAIRWALAAHDPDMALRMAGSCATFWWIHGHWTEGRTWLEAALELREPQDPRLRAVALEGGAHLAMRQHDLAHARSLIEEALAIVRGLPGQPGIARSLRVLGLIAASEDDRAGFLECTEASLEHARESNDQWALAMALNNLGYMALEAEDVDRAAALFSEAIAVAHERRDDRSEAFFLENLALARLEQGRTAEARDAYATSLRLARRVGFVEVEETDLLGIAAIAAASGQPAEAARILGGSERLRERTGASLDTVETRVWRRTMTELERVLGSEGIEMERSAGRRLASDEVFDLALQLVE